MLLTLTLGPEPLHFEVTLRMRPTVYLSIDGILAHIGFSQVFRVVEGLAQRGIPYALVSLEREKDLADHHRVAAIQARAKQSGIDWVWGVYREGGGLLAVAENMGRLGALATRQVLRHRSRLLHARAYHSALVTAGLSTSPRRRWIFDARSYWIDERLEEHRWFTTPRRLAVARSVERQLFSSCDAVVTLTQLQADDVLRGEFGRPKGQVLVIPTCADFDEFRPRCAEELSLVPSTVRERLAGKLVLGIVGSLNRAYLGPQTARLATEVLRRRVDAHVLVLSTQRDEWMAAFAAEGAPLERVTICRANHEAMPQWLNLLTWAVLLLAPETRAKRAAMPTKLAEFFATGVRVCAHGCNQEVTEWVDRAGGGLVLRTMDDETLLRAAAHISSVSGHDHSARERARAHFSLQSGLDRYERLVNSLVG